MSAGNWQQHRRQHTNRRHVWKPTVSAQAHVSRCCPDETGRRLLRALAAGPNDGKWRVRMLGAGHGADGSPWVQAGIRPS